MSKQLMGVGSTTRVSVLLKNKNRFSLFFFILEQQKKNNNKKTTNQCLKTFFFFQTPKSHWHNLNFWSVSCLVSRIIKKHRRLYASFYLLLSYLLTNIHTDIEIQELKKNSEYFVLSSNLFVIITCKWANFLLEQPKKSWMVFFFGFLLSKVKIKNDGLG